MFLQKYKHRKVLERGDLQCIFIVGKDRADGTW